MYYEINRIHLIESEKNMQVLIDVVRDYVPKNGDMLVYNAENGTWVCEQKSYVLKEQDKKLEEMRKENAQLRAENENFKQEIRGEINTLANAVSLNLKY